MGLTYYRIKTVDNDGTYEMSAIVSVRPDQYDNADGRLYPNPVRDGKTTLVLAQADGKADILITDMAGRKRNIRVSEATRGRYELETSALPAGLYLVKVHIADASIWVSRLLVE